MKTTKNLKPILSYIQRTAALFRSATLLKPAVVLLSCLLLLTSASGQDIHFSQFFETPLLRNPALAGVFTGDYRIQTVFRDQWNSFSNAYRTGSLSGEYRWSAKGNDFFTTGLEILYDKAGTAALETTEVMPALNYHKS